MKLTKVNPIWYFTLICVVAYSVWYYVKLQNRELVLEGYDLAKGRMDEYWVVGTIKSRYLAYSYIVNKKKYQSETAAASRFKGCEHDFSLCSDKRFWVAYEKGNPSNSLINLNIEIQNLENPEPPKTLEGFR
jgi:hypothetical protein